MSQEQFMRDPWTGAYRISEETPFREFDTASQNINNLKQSWPNFIIIRMTCSNLFYWSDFLCFLFLNYSWIWENSVQRCFATWVARQVSAIRSLCSQQVSQLPDQSSRGSSTETTVRPVSSNHSSTANSLAERRNSSRTSIERQAETHQVNRVQVAKVRTIPGDGLIGVRRSNEQLFTRKCSSQRSVLGQS